jgi:hypothetical protein
MTVAKIFFICVLGITKTFHHLYNSNINKHMKKLLILVPSILFILSFTSCVEEESPKPTYCQCGTIVQRGIQGLIWIKNDCTGNVKTDRPGYPWNEPTGNTYCYSDPRYSW